MNTVNINWGDSPGNIANCILKTTDPKFVGPLKTGLGYKLQSTSPAINAGVIIPGITDGSVGAPDIGAYEFGGPDWIPGYTPVPTTTPKQIRLQQVASLLHQTIPRLHKGHPLTLQPLPPMLMVR